MTRIVVIGGGPGGYEAALVARRLGGEVTVVDSDGIGGSCVLTDCVPSKTLVATAEVMSTAATSDELGVVFAPGAGVSVDLAKVNARVLALASAQSADIRHRLVEAGVRVVTARGSLAGPDVVLAEGDTEETIPADVDPRRDRARTPASCPRPCPTASGF